LPDEEAETLLVGGTANRGQVVRVGDTVRRPQRPTSPATHALLRHLADVGFTGAPRVLGIDELDREVLSFVPGTAITPPFPEWALTDEALAGVAALLRSYHRAVETFDSSPHVWPQSAPEAFRGELISHNDVNLDNVVFRGGQAVALIDFDLASPGSRLWDVAGAVRLWAPLRPEHYIDDTRRARVLARFRLFVDSYGLAREDRHRLVEAIRQNHNRSYDLVSSAVANGHAGFADYCASGALVRAAQTHQWYLDNGHGLQNALL
jgi:Ser/Thr protein kinase RdoA (MazF antagonist)